MKRDPALVPLSHEHHRALHAAALMKRATADDAAAVRDEAMAFWDGEGASHFRIEEDILLPAFAAKGDPRDEAVVRVLVDHVWIRERMERVAADELEPSELHELGERLEQHVRHEERVLFPLVEGALEPDALTALGERIAAAEAS